MNGVTWTRVSNGDEIEASQIRDDIGQALAVLQGGVDGSTDIESVTLRHLYRADVIGWPLEAVLGNWLHVYHAANNAIAPSTADGTDTTGLSSFTAATVRDDFLAVPQRITVTRDCIQTRQVSGNSEQFAPIPGSARRVNLFHRTNDEGEQATIEIEARLSVYMASRYIDEGGITFRLFGYPPVSTTAEAEPYISSDAGRIVAKYQRVDQASSVETFEASHRELYSSVKGDLTGTPDAADMLDGHVQLYNVELFSYAQVDPGVYRVWLEWATDENLAQSCQALVISDMEVTIEVALEG